MTQLAGILLLTLTPYSQAPAIAPYSLSPSDTRPVGRLEMRTDGPVVGSSPEASGETSSGTGGVEVAPYMGLGFEFLRGSKGPDVNVALGMQLKSNDFVLKIVPEIVMTTGSKWDASVMGGFWYGATAELEAHFGNFWLEPSLKIVKYQDRNLGDPEKQTTYSEEDSLRVALGLAYQPVSGLYASAKQKMWALGKSNLTSPGLNLDMASDVIWVSELTVGWSWDRKRLSGRVITVSGVNNDEQHAFRARGAFEDHLLSKQRAEVEMQWLF